MARFSHRLRSIPASDREAARGLYYLPYRCPAPFGRGETHRYLVPPLTSDSNPAEQQRQLRATNDSVIKLNHVIITADWPPCPELVCVPGELPIGQIAGVDCASRIAMFGGRNVGRRVGLLRDRPHGGDWLYVP